jgi:hypothetical protein
MKFAIIRGYDDSVCPATGAYKDHFVRQDVRIVDDPKKIQFYGHTSDWWYSEGKNHRIEHGQIVRDFDSESWYIDFNTIEELVNFCLLYRAKIAPHFQNYTVPCIEI